MSSSKNLILGAVLHGVGAHGSQLWRHPDVPVNASIDINWYTKQAQEAEAAGIDFVFIVDSQFIDPGFPAHHLNRLEPLTLLSAVAARTSSIGLIATVSTTYSEPFDIARRIASLDHISNGRAGWNIVTSQDPGTATNFSRSEHGDYATRYARARESVEVVTALWDSYEPGAFSTDKSAQDFLDPDRQHRLGHVGDFFSVAGPLNIAASRQGRPVLVQAGTSDDGRDLSAAVADVVFTFSATREDAAEFRADVERRLAIAGRSADDVLFIPALEIVVTGTHSEEFEQARRKGALNAAYFGLGRAFGGYDFRQHDLDAPFPDVPDVLGGGERTVGQAARIKERAAAHGSTLREVLEGRGAEVRIARFEGSPNEIADEIALWYESGAVDGFNLFVNTPEDWRAYRERVIPILQERGLISPSPADATLRQRLGLPDVPNRYVAARGETEDSPAFVH